MVGLANMSADRHRHMTSLALAAASLVIAFPWGLKGHTAQDALPKQACLVAPTTTCLFVEAERVATSIGNAALRAMTLAKIAAEYGNATVENAELHARLILIRARTAVSDPGAAAPVLLGKAQGDIASAEARLGNSDDALETAAGISDAEMRDFALVSIAGIQAADDDVVGALLTAARIDDANYHAWALREVARAQSEAGNLADSLATANGIGSPIMRDIALLNIAFTFARTGRLTEALEAAEGIGQEALRARVASLTAVKAGDLEGALRIASSIDDGRASALGDVAQALAEGGDVVGGLRVANSIEDAHDRVGALAGIAEAQADNDDITGALRTCRTMQNVLRPLERRVRAGASVSMLFAVADIAVKQASSGDPTGAILSATEFLGGSALAEALARIATAISRNQ